MFLLTPFQSAPRTPSAGRRGRKPNKSHLLKTPHRLRRRIDQGIDVDDDSDPSFSEGSEDEDDDEEESDDDEDAKNNNEKKMTSINKTPAAPSLFDKKAPTAPVAATTPSKPKKTALKRAVDSKTSKLQTDMLI